MRDNPHDLGPDQRADRDPGPGADQTRSEPTHQAFTDVTWALDGFREYPARHLPREPRHDLTEYVLHGGQTGYDIKELRADINDLYLQLPGKPADHLAELFPLDETHGVQTRQWGGGRFTDIEITGAGDPPKTYLWTVDTDGLHIIREGPNPYAPEQQIKHTNLSQLAMIGGEARFTGNDTVDIDPNSGRFGRGSEVFTKAGPGEDFLSGAVSLWESLGYTVKVRYP
jgi:hypothetical protein